MIIERNLTRIRGSERRSIIKEVCSVCSVDNKQCQVIFWISTSKAQMTSLFFAKDRLSTYTYSTYLNSTHNPSLPFHWSTNKQSLHGLICCSDCDDDDGRRRELSVFGHRVEKKWWWNFHKRHCHAENWDWVRLSARLMQKINSVGIPTITEKSQ